MNNFWELFIINTALNIVHVTVKNPAKAVALKAHLLEVADAIYNGYGMTPPTQS